MTKEKMIDDLLEDMEDWDLDVLVQMAYEYRRDLLEGSTPDEVKAIWEETFPGN
jgi:hypothetical protein